MSIPEIHAAVGTIDALIVTYDPEKHILLVGRKTKGMYPDVINAFQGADADDIYKQLTFVRKTDDEHSKS